ncbi:hypothetical protein DFP72DRAFT_1078071 [Ephemerocybe angulata]|uniref:Uncharacterized protein n=1 Tax=Ephemerocybe angulata TaxID=980116 RepID=A0A8H6HD54_9AGAR|nr:hypothetical protein DFP72DRAFT_1078071 [Tulosesus angulatus]
MPVFTSPRPYREEIVSLPNRDRRLPAIYEAFNHPFDLAQNGGRTFIIKMNTHPAAMNEAAMFERSMEVPQGQLPELEAAGLLQMNKGDFLLGRDLSSTSPEKDLVVAWVVGRESIDPVLMKKLDDAIKKALGERHTRTPTKVYMEDGASPVGKPTNRSYNIAVGVERPKVAIAPQANLKNGVSTPFKECAQDLSKAITPVAMANFEAMPQSLRDKIRERSEIFGLPRIGHSGNYAYHTIQCNISAAKNGALLMHQLGTVGGAHFDNHDSPGHYSNMVTHCDLPPGWHPGYFHLLALGVFVILENGLGFNFQGNRKHGGSGPFAPDDAAEDVPWAYRFAGICYPPAEMVGQECRYRLAALAGGGHEGLHLTPEMMNPTYTTDMQTGATRALWFRDALSIMDRQSYVNFVARTLYDVNRYFLNQAPEEIRLDFDNDGFFPLISFDHEDGSRGQAEVWKYAPPVGKDRAPEFQEKWKKAAVIWAKHVEQMTLMLPCKSLPVQGADSATHAMDTAPALNIDTGQAEAESSGMAIGRGTKRNHPENEIEPVAVRSSKRARMEKVQNAVTGEESREEHDGEGPSFRVVGKNLVHHDQRDHRVPSAVQDEHSGSSDEEGAPEAPGGPAILQVDASRGSNSKRTRKGSTSTTVTRKPAGTSSKRKQKGKDVRAHPEKPSGNLYPFLQQSSIQQLQREVMELAAEREAVEAQAREDSTASESAAEFMLEEACESIKSNPLDLENLGKVSNILKCSSQVHAGLLHQQHTARESRRTIVMATLESWRWMQLTLPKLARDLQEGDRRHLRQAKTWLAKLVVMLQGEVRGTKEDVLISATQCGFPNSIVDIARFQNKWARRVNLTEPEVQTIVSDAVSSIVMEWMGWARGKQEKQAWFLHTVVSALDEEVVTMDYVWALISQLKCNDIILGPNPHRCTYPKGLEGFVQSFERHPIRNPKSSEGQVYRVYAQLYRGDIDTTDIELPTPNGSWEQFIDMLSTSHQYVRDPQSPPSNARFYRLLSDDPDFYLPLREKAPSRVRSRSELGPYRQGVIETPSGIFSAVVWRAITFRSAFSAEHMLFQNSDELQALVDKLVEEQSDIRKNHTSASQPFFCNKAAYGQPTGRALKYHTTYWETVENLNWNAFATSKPSFRQVLEYFGPVRQLGLNQPFPQLGDLGRLTLAGDLVYAGICEMPTTKEMAEAIVELNSGATAGLKALQYMTDQWPSLREEKVEVVAEALASLLDLLHDSLGEEVFAEMGLDLISLEHSLKGKEVKSRYGDQDLDIDNFAVAIAAAEPMASGSGVSESMDPLSEAREETQMTGLYTGQPPPEPEAMNVDQQTAADADDNSEQPGHRRSKRLRNMKAKQPIEDKLASTVPIDSVPLSSMQSGEPVGPQDGISPAPTPAEARRGILDDNEWKSTPVNVFGLYKRYWTLEKAPPDPDHFITIEDLDDSAKPTTASQGDLSKLGSLSNPFHPFPNLSSFLLGEWFWSDEEKSRESFQRLIGIITREDFSPQDVRLAKWDKINSALASSEFEDRAEDEGQLWLDDGTSWQVTSIPLDIPFNKAIGTHAYVIPNFRYRPLIPIILDRLQNSNGHGDYFHFLPTDLRWRTEDGLDVRVYGDLHHSPAFLQAYRDIQLSAPELSEDSLPRYVLGMMFASDATTLAMFGGSANIWPLYLLLGNDSKYRRGRPSLQLFEEVAYFETLPDQLTDWYIQHRPGKKGVPDTMKTHLKRELFQAQWRVLLDDEFVHAYEHGLVVDCFDNVRRRVYPRIMTYSADYPEKIMVVNIRQKGDHPCTRCLIHIDEVAGMGSKDDRLKRESERRKDDSERKRKVLQARKYIYKRYNAVNHKDVEELLKPSSLVPTQNAFSDRLSSFGLDIYSLPAVDILHEVEIGIWKDLFIQLLRMLEVVDKTRIPVLNARFRAIATFGSDTIRCFSNNVSGMKQFAARDYENILQCALPAFEGLFPVDHEARIQDVLFTLAHWHSLAKMRIHTDLTVTVLDLWTTTLGEDCRLFEEKTCKVFPTQELQREYEARKRREARESSKKDKADKATKKDKADKADKATTSGKAGRGKKKETPASTIPTALGQAPLVQEQAPAATGSVPATSAAHVGGRNDPEPSASPLVPGDGVLATPANVVPNPTKSSSRAAEDDGRKAKSWNLNVPKFHGLGYVASYIRAYGTTDSYSTQQSE